MFRVGASDVRALERVMNQCQKDLEPLRSFVLPGGGPVSAVLHQARTVCRRAEREIIRLAREEAVGDFVVPYVNRLSDLLFVLSRWIGRKNGEAESLWERGLRNRARPAAARRKRSAAPGAAQRRTKR
jgi:cob(I)alamin adenosyltransferase